MTDTNDKQPEILDESWPVEHISMMLTMGALADTELFKEKTTVISTQLNYNRIRDFALIYGGSEKLLSKLLTPNRKQRRKQRKR